MRLAAIILSKAFCHAFRGRPRAYYLIIENHMTIRSSLYHLKTEFRFLGKEQVLFEILEAILETI
mgnify:CR=1 FL=1